MGSERAVVIITPVSLGASSALIMGTALVLCAQIYSNSIREIVAGLKN